MNEHPQFCANELCRLHVPAEPEVTIALVPRGGAQVKIARHLVETDTKKKLTLCDVCVNVLKLTAS